MVRVERGERRRVEERGRAEQLAEDGARLLARERRDRDVDLRRADAPECVAVRVGHDRNGRAGGDLEWRCCVRDPSASHPVVQRREGGIQHEVLGARVDWLSAHDDARDRRGRDDRRDDVRRRAEVLRAGRQHDQVGVGV